ncbi:MAG: hypothetical protein M3467_03765 [Actinomycetota bacterium]|nr:hypothetical protein [Actinomycetota bacterium]
MRMTVMMKRDGAGRAEDGAAVITVLLLLLALTAVSGTVAVVATNDFISAGRDRQAASALAVADAGVAQAVQFIRNNGVGRLTCLESQSDPPTGSCAASAVSTPWASPSAPQQVRTDGTAGACVTGQPCYRVWISAVTPYNPPATRTGVYRVHSTGFGGGAGAKAVLVDVSATPSKFPVGVFGEELSGNGGTSILQESLFTRACISPRYSGAGNGTRFTGIDSYWDMPASAHSTSFISTGNNCQANGYIHRTNVCATGSGNALIYDRDSQGGPVGPGSPCYRTHQRADGTWYPENDTTVFTAEDLARYGYRPGGLTDAQYADLKTRAQSIGAYNVPTGQLSAALTAAVNAGVSNPVVYYEDQDVSLRYSDIPATFGRTPESACTAPHSVTVVVRRGDLTYQGGNTEWRSLAMFVPEGNYRGDGGYNVLGTLFARSISLGGNETFQLDSCFTRNMPGPLLDLQVTGFREDDRSDVQ